jgi:hypothetical protein
MMRKSGYRFSEKIMLIKSLDRRFDRCCSERLAERAGPFKSVALRLVGSLGDTDAYACRDLDRSTYRCNRRQSSRTPIRPLVSRSTGWCSLLPASLGGVCNTMIYGNALGAPAQSVQIPALVRQAKASGVARYIGRGLNRWSNVHIADVAALYTLAIAKAPASTFMYVESGEEALAEIAKAIAARLGLGAPQSWSAEQAIAAWGWNMAVFSLGSNSRVRGKAAADLGWSPTQRSVTRWIASELT